MRVLVTGAGGFVGRNLCEELEKAGFDLAPVLGSSSADSEQRMPRTVFGMNIDATTDWADALVDIDVVIHLAAKVHVMGGEEMVDLAGFRDTNVAGTRNLAMQAARANVKRFVYLSSIKVNGEETSALPFRFDQPVHPGDAYSQSKMEAEQILREIESIFEMDVVIIRPPLVYGPGAKGNLLALVNIVRKGVPLPLGAIRNRRDLVSIYNLCDLIRVCCLHPQAGGNTFLVSDGESISTPELIRYIAKGIGRKIRLFPIPVWLLNVGAVLSGQVEKVERLTGDLQIDLSPTQNILDWKPPLTVAESFRKMFAEG